ncbi:MAG: NAD-dependent deacylase [Pseudomonadales bacterium]
MAKDLPSIVVLTGAGISAESGVKTFRDAGGLWEGHRVEDVATPEAFVRNPLVVQDFYNQRRQQLTTVEPNAAHIALADFEGSYAGEFLLVTQNVDNLHERAGSRKLLHMHGELLNKYCTLCFEVSEQTGDLGIDDCCVQCGQSGGLRPDIVWFGEMPKYMDTIYDALARCKLFLSIGTSGNVYPAAGFVQVAAEAGAQTIEINLDPGGSSRLFSQHIHGKAGECLPAYLKNLLVKV